MRRFVGGPGARRGGGAGKTPANGMREIHRSRQRYRGSPVSSSNEMSSQGNSRSFVVMLKDHISRFRYVCISSGITNLYMISPSTLSVSVALRVGGFPESSAGEMVRIA